MIITPSCKLYLPFEGNALDASGNGNNGTVSGAVLTTGKFGQRYYFDGVNDVITVAHNDNLVGMPGLTISAWVNQASGYGPIVEKLISSLGYIWYVGTASGTVKQRIYINASAGVNSNTFLPANQWVHIAFVYNQINVMFYLNGIADGSPSLSVGAVGSNTRTLSIGLYGSSEKFKGSMDEVMIFNRALGESDVRRLMLKMHPLGG